MAESQHNRGTMEEKYIAELAGLRIELEHSKTDRDKIHEKLDAILKIVTPLEGLEPRVRAVESEIDKARGGVGALIVIGTVCGALFDFVLHKLFPK